MGTAHPATASIDQCYVIAVGRIQERSDAAVAITALPGLRFAGSGLQAAWRFSIDGPLPLRLHRPKGTKLMKTTLSVCLLTIATALPASADDRNHPYFPRHDTAHASLNAGSPRHFRPAYGYVTPRGLVSPNFAIPYLSQQADTPLRPYSSAPIVLQRTQSRQTIRVGRPWYVPGDIVTPYGPSLQKFGQLPRSVNTHFGF